MASDPGAAGSATPDASTGQLSTNEKEEIDRVYTREHRKRMKRAVKLMGSLFTAMEPDSNDKVASELISSVYRQLGASNKNYDADDALRAFLEEEGLPLSGRNMGRDDVLKYFAHEPMWAFNLVQGEFDEVFVAFFEDVLKGRPVKQFDASFFAGEQTEEVKHELSRAATRQRAMRMYLPEDERERIDGWDEDVWNEDGYDDKRKIREEAYVKKAKQELIRLYGQDNTSPRKSNLKGGVDMDLGDAIGRVNIRGEQSMGHGENDGAGFGGGGDVSSDNALSHEGGAAAGRDLHQQGGGRVGPSGYDPKDPSSMGSHVSNVGGSTWNPGQATVAGDSGAPMPPTTLHPDSDVLEATTWKQHVAGPRPMSSKDVVPPGSISTGMSPRESRGGGKGSSVRSPRSGGGLASKMGLDPDLSKARMAAQTYTYSELPSQSAYLEGVNVPLERQAALILDAEHRRTMRVSDLEEALKGPDPQVDFHQLARIAFEPASPWNSSPGSPRAANVMGGVGIPEPPEDAVVPADPYSILYLEYLSKLSGEATKFPPLAENLQEIRSLQRRSESMALHMNDYQVEKFASSAYKQKMRDRVGKMSVTLMKEIESTIHTMEDIHNRHLQTAGKLWEKTISEGKLMDGVDAALFQSTLAQQPAAYVSEIERTMTPGPFHAPGIFKKTVVSRDIVPPAQSYANVLRQRRGTNLHSPVSSPLPPITQKANDYHQRAVTVRKIHSRDQVGQVNQEPSYSHELPRRAVTSNAALSSPRVVQAQINHFHKLVNESAPSPLSSQMKKSWPDVFSEKLPASKPEDRHFYSLDKARVVKAPSAYMRESRKAKELEGMLKGMQQRRTEAILFMKTKESTLEDTQDILNMSIDNRETRSFNLEQVVQAVEGNKKRVLDGGPQLCHKRRPSTYTSPRSNRASSFSIPGKSTARGLPSSISRRDRALEREKTQPVDPFGWVALNEFDTIRKRKLKWMQKLQS